MTISRVFKNALQVTQKPPKSYTKVDFSKGFGFQLYKALELRSIELKILHERGVIPDYMLDPIQKFVDHIFEAINSTEKLNDRLTKAFMREIDVLDRSLINFDLYIDEYLQFHSPDDLLLASYLSELFDDVRHFVQQIKITHTSIPASMPVTNMPNRPTDWDKKNYFVQLVMQHQRIHGNGKYPRYKLIEPKMINAGFSLSERTYSDWKKQHRSNTFNWLIQDR